MTHVLVIEDETMLLENIKETLEMEYYDVSCAENGRVGVEVALREKPDLIVCDIMMPELDGFGVLLELRSNPVSATIPFIFLTARADRGSMRQGMEMGADDYLTKPFTPNELITAVKARLEKHAAVVQEYKNKLDHLRTSIIYTLPHELRTPLNGILGCADFLMMDFENIERERMYSIAEIILRSGQRLHKVLENYLLYAQIEVIHSDRERVEAIRASTLEYPAAIIDEMAQKVAMQAERPDDLQMSLENAVVAISEGNLRKLVNELLDNAFKFSKPGTPVVIQAGVNDGEGTYTLSVHDQGRGMTPEEINGIDAYTQFNRKLYEQQGLGLGLIIAKRLIELHNGQMIIESAPEQGTTVHSILPLA